MLIDVVECETAEDSSLEERVGPPKIEVGAIVAPICSLQGAFSSLEVVGIESQSRAC
jgi:hypothetical protein